MHPVLIVDQSNPATTSGPQQVGTSRGQLTHAGLDPARAMPWHDFQPPADSAIPPDILFFCKKATWTLTDFSNLFE